MSVSEIRAILEKAFLAAGVGLEGNLVCREESLSRLTGFRTGGPATVVFPLTEQALCLAVSALRQAEIPTFLLGNGSNVLALDEGYDGAVLCLTSLKEIRLDGERIFAQCGAGLTQVSSFAEKHSLAGMEFCYGIPGTVGGAVFMNAGAYGGECKDIVTAVRALMPDGAIRTFSTEEAGFGYRESVFQENGAVILSAEFSLTPGDGATIRTAMQNLMARRREKQPLEYPSCGSTFKRLPGRFTAQLIDEAGLKGKRVGGAMVSEKHAGFLINYDHATSRDILDLVDLVRQEILRREGEEIQCEIRILQ